MNVSSVAVSGPIIAAVVAGVLALIGVAWNQYPARQDARRKDFAQALTAVERYAELPYRVLRRQDSTPEVHGRIAEFIHEVQQALLFHKSWIRIHAPRVADVYDSLLRATREEAGSAITEAWNTKPSSKDEDMPFGMGLSFPRMAEERVKYVQAVSYELEFPPPQIDQGLHRAPGNRATEQKELRAAPPLQGTVIVLSRSERPGIRSGRSISTCT